MIIIVIEGEGQGCTGIIIQANLHIQSVHNNFFLHFCFIVFMISVDACNISFTLDTNITTSVVLTALFLQS